MNGRSLSDLSPNDAAVPMPRVRWALRVGIPAGLILLVAGLLGTSLRDSFQPVTPVGATPVVELPAKTPPHVDVDPGRKETALLQAAGWIEADPYPVAVAALDSGTVDEVLVREGDTVSEGDVLVRLVDVDARLALARAETELSAAESSWELDTVNQHAVATTAARVEETGAEMELRKAESEALSAKAREAERTWQRYQSLAASGSASDADYVAAEAGWHVARASLDAAQSRIGIARAQHVAAEADARAAAEVARHRVEEMRKLDLCRIAVEEARLRLERMELRAPIQGIVMRRLVSPGARLLVDADAPEASRALLLYDPTRLQVRVDIPLADAARVGVGTPAEVTVELLAGRKFRGVVTRVAGEADIQKNTLQVKVQLLDLAPGLRPEMLARARFLQAGAGESVPPDARSVFVPGAGIRDGVAFVVTGFDGAEGTARARRVSLTGAEQDGWLEVKEGLRPGDLVVTRAPRTLAEGLRVRVQSPVEER